MYFNLTCDGATKTIESSYGSLGMLNVELNQSLNQFDCSQINKDATHLTNNDLSIVSNQSVPKTF